MVDDLVIPEHYTTGRPPLLTTGELVTILVWNMLTIHSHTLKGIYQHIKLYHQNDFPRFPTYAGFVAHCHRILPQLYMVLSSLLQTKAPLRFIDATMLPVCKPYRAHTHKVAKDIAQFGKNWQGWHYGFKLHASVNHKNQLCGVALTPANVHDAQMMYRLLNKYTRVAVGDTLYGARVMCNRMWRRYHTIVIAPPHPKQKKKLMDKFQHMLLMLRPKIEAVFGYLKEYLHLVTSFPRSVNGYVLHYLIVLIGYQLSVL